MSEKRERNHEKNFISRLKKMRSDIGLTEEVSMSTSSENTSSETTKAGNISSSQKGICLNSSPIFISVLVRASITKKVFSIWQSKLPSLNKRIVDVSSNFFNITKLGASPYKETNVENPSNKDPICYVIMANETTTQQFKKWSNNWYSSGSESCTSCCYFYLTPEWAYSYLRSGKHSDIEKSLASNLHSLHTSLPLAISLPDRNIYCHYECPNNVEKFSGDVTISSTKPHVERKIASGNDSQDEDYKKPNAAPIAYRRKYACMVDSNPELDKYSVSTNKEKKTENLNSHITEKFSELQKIYEMEGDHWRARTYKQACNVLRQLPFRVTDSEQLADIGGKGKGCMGKSVLAKIQEIITTNDLTKLTGLHKLNPDINTRMEFDKIWGVGAATAKSLVEQGYQSIEHLRAAMQVYLSNSDKTDISEGAPSLPPRCPLNVQQMIGLNRYEDLLTRMDRNEVEDIYSVVSTAVKEIDPGASCIVCGSYRRGKPDSGDIDILIYPDDGREKLDLLPQLLNSLTLSGFLTDHLSVPHNYQGYYPPLPYFTPDPGRSLKSPQQASGACCTEECLKPASPYDSSGTAVTQIQSQVVDDRKRQRNLQSKRNANTSEFDTGTKATYMGVCRLPKKENSTGTRREFRHRRIDLKTYSRSSLAFALLYFTGSAHFNRSMRLYCRKLNYSLSDEGLYPCSRDMHNVRTYTSPQSVECKTEREVFDVLGLEYKEPWNRNTFDNEDIVKPKEK